jgi:hypothetical protein
MISERTFASSFSGFWAELLPLLTPSFVHMVDAGYRESLMDTAGAVLDPVPKSPETRDPAVVAEFAFFLARTAFSGGMGVEECFGQVALRTRAEADARQVVATYQAGHERFQGGMNGAELNEGLALARHYQAFLERRRGTGAVEFSPPIRGAGFLSACRGDLSAGDALFEVKTVERNLASKDIRQLVVYLALQHVTGERRWGRAGFMNPRNAVSYEFGVDDLVTRMSGGRPAPEVFRDLVDFVCTREVQIESPF